MAWEGTRWMDGCVDAVDAVDGRDGNVEDGPRFRRRTKTTMATTTGWRPLTGRCPGDDFLDGSGRQRGTWARQGTSRRPPPPRGSRRRRGGQRWDRDEALEESQRGKSQPGPWRRRAKGQRAGDSRVAVSTVSKRRAAPRGVKARVWVTHEAQEQRSAWGEHTQRGQRSAEAAEETPTDRRQGRQGSLLVRQSGSMRRRRHPPACSPTKSCAHPSSRRQAHLRGKRRSAGTFRERRHQSPGHSDLTSVAPKDHQGRRRKHGGRDEHGRRHQTRHDGHEGTLALSRAW